MKRRDGDMESCGEGSRPADSHSGFGRIPLKENGAAIPYLQALMLGNPPPSVEPATGE